MSSKIKLSAGFLVLGFLVLVVSIHIYGHVPKELNALVVALLVLLAYLVKLLIQFDDGLSKTSEIQEPNEAQHES